MINRAEIVDQNFVSFCHQALGDENHRPRRNPAEPLDPASGMTGHDLLELFESQLLSRHLDLATRLLRKDNRTFYTIGSSGHEGNAVIGRLARHSDPAFLHYRSGALMMERARHVPGIDMVRDTLLGMMAAAEEPIAGGRHKVWGSIPLWVPPQTSTIASHLPKAVGAAIAFTRARHVGATPNENPDMRLPPDAIFLCTFGDASSNHSVATGAFNTAGWASFQKLPTPILFVCEDNDIGISVRSPAGWVEANFRARPGIQYFGADGLNLVNAYRVAREAISYVRRYRRPAFLHLKVVRLMGHAGTDVETEYRGLDELAACEARDPLLVSARLLISYGLRTPDEVLAMYEAARDRVLGTASALGTPRKLTAADEIIRPLAPLSPERVLAEATRPAELPARIAAFGGESQLPETQPPRHMAVLINRALHDLMAKYAESILFGEDVAAKGGVYHVTAGLLSKFGVGRVFNTLLDETSILGMAIGAAHLGLLPFPEIQYLAYLHNAIDQLRGEACSTQFFSNAQYRNPMVVRIASLAYQKGFGGHFHNDNSTAALRDIPGLMVCVPSRGDDAVKLLRTCAALAKVDGRVVAFLEPIALYMTKDLYEDRDSQWQFAYPPPNEAIPVGEGHVYHPDADDLTILTYGNGVYFSLRAAKTLRDEHNVAARVVDLRWLCPLNAELIVRESVATGRVLVVDEGRHSGGVAEPVMAILLENCGDRVAARRLCGHDTYIPLGPAANLILPTEPEIVRAALALQSDKQPVTAG